MLVHLPFDYDSSLSTTISSSPLSSATISELPASETQGDEPIPVLGATYNPAFGRFLTMHGLELRRELRGSTPGVGVWYAGSRMGRYGPSSVEMPKVGEAVDGKRAEGRPRKSAPSLESVPEGSRSVSTSTASTPKPRGRPRKTPTPPSEEKSASRRPWTRSLSAGSESEPDGILAPPPPPTSPTAAVLPKRPRGRPRKTPAAETVKTVE